MNTFGETKSINGKNDFTFNLRFAGQYHDNETGYYYNYHRYYNPQTGRYLTSDPIGLNGGSLNTYAYVDSKPWAGVDVWGLYSITKNGITTFYTQFHLLPKFSIPTPKGWKDYKDSDEYYHKYNQNVPVSDLSKAQEDRLEKYLAKHPTPNSKAKPATQAGTVNNPASPDFGPFFGVASMLVAPDDVTSYLFTGINRKKFVVNVTQENHSLKYGIVIRGLECKSTHTLIHNYGEGNGFHQDAFYANALINNIWYWATEHALEQVTGRKYEVNGYDWTGRAENIPIMP